ncbi:CehA/McbA family metallohydrolase [Kordiimonas marina]|uniref:CehA/McbA family metallohydrolase n=1 Tax=Kordiimonas marina TaxID=2872312 RepID=UPI001FF19F24|nr:CehA/McbA family metallohydrolase [Kordiimonas marina]MCJ9430648.1 CehA/McbA family metallohydrolase [Kordiimonas marina]
MKRLSAAIIGGLLVTAALTPVQNAWAESGRVPAMGKVDHPHSYYWREMYLPQLTAGPSAVAFSPDGKSVIYSMAGSLWRQEVGSGRAVELTAGHGYDLQPDWAPDGRTVYFSRKDGDAYNLMRLDLASGKVTALTTGDGVNVEPRLSPDGKHIAYVSSAVTHHFNLYVADVTDAGIANARFAVTPRESKIDRYYYGKADHAVNPSWSPDGKRIYYVSNREVAMGSGDIWSVAADNPADMKKVLNEETTWAARPELAPDGKRLLYSSYHGRQWNQLWLTTPEGLSPLPLTFGDYDLHAARWSPDGKRVAYTSNETGGLTLWVQEVVGGARTEIVAKEKVWKRPMHALTLTAADDAGKTLSARMSVLSADGRYYAPSDVRIHADDAFDPKTQTQETHYFHCPASCTIMVPEGAVTVSAMAGFARVPVTEKLIVKQGDLQEKLTLKADALPARFGSFLSADQHVHMNYAGQYKQTRERLALEAKAEGLDIIYNLAVNKEERIPDITEFARGTYQADGVTIFQGQEYHSSFWGHLGLLNLEDHYLTPDFTSYRHTAMASPYPHNGVVIDLAHKQHAIAGYVHPFDSVPDVTKPISHMLPADVAMGRADYLEIVSFADHKSTAAVWYKFLNLGYHLAAGAGTDAMTNYAWLRGPVGLNRLYISGTDRTPRTLTAAIKAGHSFATDGPLLGLLVNGQAPGSTIDLKAPGKVRVDAAVRSLTPLSDMEVVFNGKVIAHLKKSEHGRHGNLLKDVRITGSGWLLLRASDPNPSPYVQDLYPYGTTNPVWINVKGRPHKAPKDAQYFADWLAQTIKVVEGRTDDFNTAEEKAATINYLKDARARYLARAKGE